MSEDEIVRRGFASRESLLESGIDWQEQMRSFEQEKAEMAALGVLTLPQGWKATPLPEDYLKSFVAGEVAIKGIYDTEADTPINRALAESLVIRANHSPDELGEPSPSITIGQQVDEPAIREAK